MVHLAKSILRATNSLKCSFATHVSSSASSTIHKTKTKKAFADLPTSYIRPDGTVAEPLGDWGSATSSNLQSKGRKSPRRKTVAENADEHIQQLVDATTQPTRARKSKLITTSTFSSVAIEDTTPEVKVKKKRKVSESSKVSKPADTRSTKTASEPQGQPQTMLAQEILENIKKFPHCLLFTRVGNFYESYFDQANEIARLLSIKLTTRKWGSGRVPMCGFPLAHLDKHLKVLVQQHRRFVAMCEEFPRYSEGTKLFERRVTRVVTPGTLIDEPFLNPFENNYLLAIGVLSTDSTLSDTTSLGLAWIDVSTGEFFSKTTNVDNLRDELARIAPREVVLDAELQQAKNHPVHEALAEDDNFISYALPLDSPTGDVGISPTSSSQDGVIPESSENITGLNLSLEETSAVGLLTSYLHANLLEHMPALSSPNREGCEQRMQIDSHTIKALEIREGIREGGTKGSLLSVVKRTVTTGGTRLLSRWLCSPSTSISEINARQSLVAFFHARPHFHADLAEALANAEDTSRIVQKFILGRGETADLLGVKRTTHVWADIVKRVQDEKKMEATERSDFNDEDWTNLDALISRMIPLDSLSKRIGSALDDKPSELNESPESSTGEDTVQTPGSAVLLGGNDMPWHSGSTRWTIKASFSTVLSNLHDTLQKLLRQREEMERNLQLRYNALSLTLRASPSQGMHVHLAKGKRDQSRILADLAFVPIAESASTRSFFFRDWSCLGNEISETTLALAIAEKEAFETLRTEVNSHSSSLRCNAQLVDELDVALSFATLASEFNFVRPMMTDEPIYKVTNGRHPTVELGLLAAGRVFTPNSVILTPTTRLHVITGPNMAGKSTFLRQTALITILAQTGSFVPADFAMMGIVDKLFSRVGAKDDLFHDRSTFMVEMLETSEILRRATAKSLVIMDEVGRGTTVTDGLAIAYATLHHLVNTNQCRALFATHFHELSDMLGYPHQHEGDFGSVEFFCTDVDETDDNHFAYQYRIRPGVNRDSHGLKVAQLAGMPSAAVKVAKDTLAILKARKG